MRYSGVLFDLFGTLVAPFRMREHRKVIQECANLLDIHFDKCHQYWVETFPQRIRGDFTSIADNFDWIVRKIGQRATPIALMQAEETYEQFTIEGLKPVADALEILEWLKAREVRVGLVSNCSPDIVHVWGKSAFAKYFGYCAFSCRVGVIKPEPEIYCSALDALSLLPNETLYIGDGSDEELSGAARCGMQPVLISVDLSNTYDAQRKDVVTWKGPIIHSLKEIQSLLVAST